MFILKILQLYYLFVFIFIGIGGALSFVFGMIIVISESLGWIINKIVG